MDSLKHIITSSRPHGINPFLKNLVILGQDNQPLLKGSKGLHRLTRFSPINFGVRLCNLRIVLTNRAFKLSLLVVKLRLFVEQVLQRWLDFNQLLLHFVQSRLKIHWKQDNLLFQSWCYHVQYFLYCNHSISLYCYSLLSISRTLCHEQCEARTDFQS